MADPLDATLDRTSVSGVQRPWLGWLGLPSWLLLALLVLPLALGSKTLFYRDVLSTHYPLKAAQAQLMDGSVESRVWPAPIVDPFRGGGQPLLGNPNAVPFYPTNVLYRGGDPLWALNAHIWIHWLLAPLAGFWLGRSWRLSRPGAWACGVAWATGGYVMSLLNLYNMVALAVLAPATVAAFVSLARSRRPMALAAAAVCVGLTFLGGDPASAALVYVLAGAAFLAAKGPAPAVRHFLRSALPAFGLGLLLTAPVLVEMLRVLPASYRGLWQYDVQSMLAQSWHPVMLLDWLVPGFFGSLDLSFWGTPVFGSNPPYFSSLVPGWLVVALAAAAGFRGSATRLWAWGAVVGGVFVALGGHNPLLSWLAEAIDIGLLRYPVKAWLAVALGLSLLAGSGFERIWRRGPARSAFLLVLVAAAAGIAWTSFQLTDAGADSHLARTAVELSDGRLAGGQQDAEIGRWRSILGRQLLFLVPILALVAFPRRPSWTPAILLLLHTSLQVSLLIGLLAMDDSAPYREPSPAADQLRSAGDVAGNVDVVHGAFDGQFGQPLGRVPGQSQDPSLEALSRTLFAETFHGAGIADGLRYPFARSPEGLDSFYASAFAKALPGLDDSGRLRLLEAAGVEYLLLNRPLTPDAGLRVEKVAQSRSLWIYRLRFGAEEVSLVGSVRRAGSMTEARDALLDPSFDPRREVILPGDGSVRAAPDLEIHSGLSSELPPKLGAVTTRDDVETLAVETTGADASYLVVQRAWLPIWRATVDGEPAQIEIANGWQMAVAVPPGRHEIRLFVDRGPGRWALGAFFLALALVGWLAFVTPGQAPTLVRGV